MKHPIDHRILASLLSCGLLIALSGCERALEVVDELENGTPDTEGPGTGTPTTPNPPVQNATCACAGSASLQALICGGGEVPLLDNDIVHTTADGSIVAFNRCDPDTFECGVMLWDGSAAEFVADGLLIGMDGSGERLLVANGSLNLVDVGGDTSELQIGMLQGSQLLTANGDFAFGSVPGVVGEERREHIGRSNAAGEIEVLGDVRGGVARSYANPTGTTLVGWTLGERGEGDDFAIVYEAFRWGASGFQTEFPGVPEGTTLWPESVSDDGATIAGRAVPDQTHFIWSEAGGYTELAPASWASETFISGDGSVVLGSIDPGGLTGTRAFRWTAETGVVELTPDAPSVALAMSDDGSVIAAYSWEDAQLEGALPEATFIWDAEHGTRTLDEVLAQRGVDTSGWEFGTPRALSGDGNVLLGLASCGGVETLYRAVLSD